LAISIYSAVNDFRLVEGMTSMRTSALKVLATAAFATIAASSAFAADMAPRYTKAPPPIVEVWNWTGFYIGGNVGYSWGRSDTDVVYYNTVTGAIVAPPPGSLTSGRFNMDGVIAGGQAGYNWQSGNWLFGIEGDLQWSDEKGSARFLCAATLIGGPCLPGLTFLPPGAGGTTLTLDQHLEWFGTLRGRVGVLATPRALFYATGGLAYGSIKSTGTLAGNNANGVAVASIGSNSEVRAGWTVGAGVEYMFARNWSGKLEYLYMDLGDFNNNFTLAPLATIGARTSSHFTDHILRAGINYQFNQPVVAKY
jgi:outer membrane immunogenic protein